MNTPDLLKVEALLEAQLEEVEQLARLCNTHEGLDIKLNWNILRGYLRIRVTSFLRYADEQLVGFLALYQFNADEAEISGMVHAAFRRRGIFTQLVRAARAACREAGVGRLLFIVDLHASSGKAFVEALQTQQLEMYEYKMTLGRPLLPASFEPELQFRQARPDEAVIGIVPQYRGRGFGRQMLARTIQELLAIGQQRITLEVEAANKNALGLYQSCGFKESSLYHYYALDIPALASA